MPKRRALTVLCGRATIGPIDRRCDPYFGALGATPGAWIISALRAQDLHVDVRYRLDALAARATEASRRGRGASRACGTVFLSSATA